MLKKLKKHLYPIARIVFDNYIAKQKNFVYRGITIKMHPEVFPPKFTISTKVLLQLLKPLNLTKKKVLELGCGSGIISLFAASKGAKVTATDINKVALQLLKEASKNNDIVLDVIYSDLFKNIQEKIFDYIIINPPYYPKTPKSDKEHAWFCGENFEYFTRLFPQLKQYLAKETWMILSEDCHIKHIKSIAKNNNLKLNLFFEKKILKEKNYVFKIVKSI